MIRNLFSLCIPGNPSLRGRIGDFLLGNMTKLLTVSFNGASIDGSIPEDIVKLNNLQNFLGCDMSGDGFSGRLPEDMGNMKELRLLCLGGNRFAGELPRSISRLRKLSYLDLQNTPGMMHGNLTDLLELPLLEELYVSGVQLIGEMPRVLPGRLKSLVLPGNNMLGTLPENFSKGNKLMKLNVANNQLTGDIPGSLFLQTNILIIDASQNQFSSVNKGKPWPDNVSGTVKSYVSLAGNRNLSINFTSFLELFTRVPDNNSPLSIMNVSFCDIKSPLLSNIFHSHLSTCDFRGNSFYGVMPDVILAFSILVRLDISKNNFSGGLPSGIQGLTTLQNLDISGNPRMREGTDSSSNVFHPDFSRMVRPPEADNFTCPEGQLTFNNGRIRLDPTFYHYKYCVCDNGYYGDKGLCKKCMEDGRCTQPSVNTPDDLRPNVMEVHKGFWPSPDPQNATHLVKCPVPSACNPTDSCTCRLDISPKDTRSSGDRQHHSVSSLTTKCNHSCICHPGNTDRFCSRCQEGFYKLGGLCFHCKSGDLTYYYMFIPIFAVSFLVLLWSYFYFNLRPIKWFAVTAVHFLLMLILMLLEFLPAWVFKLNLVVFVLCMTSRGKAARSLISIAVFYIQTLDFMVSSINIWPRKIVAAQNYLSSYWNLYFPSLSCDLPSLFTPVGKFAFLLLLPIVCLTIVGLYFVIMLMYDKFRPNIERMENVHFKCRQSAFFCLSFSYFPVVKQTLFILRPCHSDRDVLYMPSSPWIECTSDTYSTLTALGIVSVVFYVIGFPLIVISLMIRFFPKRSSMSPVDRMKLDVWLGQVYLPYKPKYQQYFEIFMLLRRLILAIALSMISPSTTLQTFAVWLVLMLAAIIHLCLQPYDKRASNHGDPSEQEQYHERIEQKSIFLENVFEPVVLVVLSMSFMVLRFSAMDSSYAGGYVWVVMIVNTCVLVALIGGIFYRLVYKGEGRSNPIGNSNSGAGNGEYNDVSAVECNLANGDEERGLLLVGGQRIYVPMEDSA